MDDFIANSDMEISLTSADNFTFTSSTINSVDELDRANRRVSNTLLPCMVYVGVLMVVGIVGNILVCYVFGYRLKRSAQNFFILVLAVFDLLSCTIGMPAEIVDMSLHYKFHSAPLCKIMRFINHLTATSSICTLIVIAIDRFRRIRKPLKSQITSRYARLSLIPISVASLFFSTPTFYVYGLRSVEFGISGVTGLDCTISDGAKNTVVPLVYNGLLFISFVFLTICLIVMYSMILLGLKEHVRVLRKASIGTLSTGHESLVEPPSVNEDTASVSQQVGIDEFNNESNDGQLFSTTSNINIGTVLEDNGKVNECFNTVTSGDRYVNEQTISSENGACADKDLSSAIWRQDKCELDISGKSPIMKTEDNRNCNGQNKNAIRGSQNSLTVYNRSSSDLDEQVTSTNALNLSLNTDYVKDDSKMTSSPESNDMLKEQQTILDKSNISNVNDNENSDIQTQGREINRNYCSESESCTKNTEAMKDNQSYNIIKEKDKFSKTDTHFKSDQICASDKIIADNAINNNDKINKNIKNCANNGVLQRTNTQHVSFNIKKRDDENRFHLNTIPHIFTTSFPERKRKMSDIPILKDLNDQSSAYQNPAYELEEKEESVEENIIKCKKLHEKKCKKSEKVKPKQRNITRKTTIIAFVVTLVFIISFVPHLCLQVAHLIYKGFDEKLKGADLALYNTFLRSYFINSVANPIIYGVLNDKFREEVKHLMTRLQCWRW